MIKYTRPTRKSNLKGSPGSEKKSFMFLIRAELYQLIQINIVYLKYVLIAKLIELIFSELGQTFYVSFPLFFLIW